MSKNNLQHISFRKPIRGFYYSSTAGAQDPFYQKRRFSSDVARVGTGVERGKNRRGGTKVEHLLRRLHYDRESSCFAGKLAPNRRFVDDDDLFRLLFERGSERHLLNQSYKGQHGPLCRRVLLVASAERETRGVVSRSRSDDPKKIHLNRHAVHLPLH